MTAREVLDRIVSLGGEIVRQHGSHVRVRAGECYTTVPKHGAKDIPVGTRRAIERDLEPALGKRWLER